MNTAFSHALRVVICPACGEAVHGSPAGGTVPCPLCEADVHLPPRDEQPLPEGLTRGSESERLERLREQDRSSVELPSDLSHLASARSLVPERLGDALTAWQELRRRLQAGDGAAEDAFYGLTLLLQRHMTGQDDDLQLRAVLETALEVLASPSYRQVMRCSLALEAARVDDIAAARDWLAPCDPRAYDVTADGGYRHAAAYIATRERNPQRVIEVLGPRGRDVPIAADRDVVCTLLRAHAYERLGRMADALDELAEGMVRVPDGIAAFDSVWQQHHDLDLCRGSYHRAREHVRATMRAPAERRRRARRRALPWIALALASFAVALWIDPSLRIGGQRLDMLFFVLALSFAVPVLVLVLRRATRR